MADGILPFAIRHPPFAIILSMPHVVLNAHLLAGGASYRSAGIHHYIDNLLRHLPAADPDFRYTVFVGEGRPSMNGATVRRSALPTGRPVVRILWEQLVQPFALRRARPDLLHSLAFVSPVAAPCPHVVTVYDLSFMLAPDTFRQRAAQRLYLSAFTAHTCRRARRVITISESTKQDVVRFWGIDPDRVDVAAPGLHPAFRPLPRPEVEAFRARRALPDRFILYLGTLEPRKNLNTLIRAFAALHPPPSSLHLILAGAKGWLYHDLFALVQQLNLTDRVIFPGFVPADELVLWYNAAEVFAYPSSYEGFGIPVAEALACGRPVVTSNVSSLPEAGGDAAILVAPHDVEALAAALARALTLEPEALARGPAHAAKFTWANTAAQTVASYRRAIDLDRRRKTKDES
jgi:glycosyltransferase involved in cell wall biosynthesis